MRVVKVPLVAAATEGSNRMTVRKLGDSKVDTIYLTGRVIVDMLFNRCDLAVSKLSEGAVLHFIRNR